MADRAGRKVSAMLAIEPPSQEGRSEMELCYLYMDSTDSALPINWPHCVPLYRSVLLKTSHCQQIKSHPKRQSRLTTGLITDYETLTLVSGVLHFCCEQGVIHQHHDGHWAAGNRRDDSRAGRNLLTDLRQAWRSFRFGLFIL